MTKKEVNAKNDGRGVIPNATDPVIHNPTPRHSQPHTPSFTTPHPVIPNLIGNLTRTSEKTP